MGNSYTPELDQHLQELHQEASKTPWKVQASGQKEPIKIISATRHGTAPETVFTPVFGPHLEAEYEESENKADINTRYAVAAANAVPVLQAEIARLREELKTAKADGWDEGYKKHIERVWAYDSNGVIPDCTNPYRSNQQ